MIQLAVRSKLLCTIFLTIVHFSYASNCILSKAFTEDPLLNSNAKFWEGYSKLSDANNGQIPDNELQNLIKKHIRSSDSETASSSHTPTYVPSRDISFHSIAKKEVLYLRGDLREKLDEFTNIIISPNGLQELYASPGRWHFEKLPQFGEHAHSVRLNGGYRVLFDVLSDGSVVIRRINKGQIHGN